MAKQLSIVGTEPERDSEIDPIVLAEIAAGGWSAEQAAGLARLVRTTAEIDYTRWFS